MAYQILKQEKEDKQIFDIEEIRHFLRINNNDDDELLTNFAKAALQMAESYLGKSFQKQYLEVQYKPISTNIAKYHIELPHAPISEIERIILFYDFQERELVAAKDYFITHNNYILNLVGSPNYDYLTISYHTEKTENLSEIIKQGLLLHVAAMYENHGFKAKIPEEVIILYEPFKRYKI